VLKAREKSLQKGEKDDIKEFKDELSKLGTGVRDEEKHQYWRKYNL
jgi:hypothetical protein